MREIAELFPLVLPFANACPEIVAEQWLRWSAIEFCKSSRLWRDHREFDVTQGCDELICCPSYAAIFEIDRASFDGNELERGQFSDIDGREGQPGYITQIRPDTVRFYPAPDYDGKAKLSLYLKPSIDAQDLPDFLIDHYGQDLANGALSRILMIPNQPYTDAGMAAFYGQMFQQAKDKNFAQNLRGQQRAPLRTKARFF